MVENEKLYNAILTGDADTAIAATQEALESGVAPLDLVSGTMIPAMDVVGEKFECEEYFIPELMISARAMKRSMEIVQPMLKKSGVQPQGRVIIGTVKGDLHDIGKNLVASMLEGGGFEVFDLGVDVKPEQVIENIKQKNANIVCLSTLLTTTMPFMASTIEALQQAGIRDQVKVIVGGAPITQDYANEIGADAYGENAKSAVSVARDLVAS